MTEKGHKKIIISPPSSPIISKSKVISLSSSTSKLTPMINLPPPSPLITRGSSKGNEKKRSKTISKDSSDIPFHKNRAALFRKSHLSNDSQTRSCNFITNKDSIPKEPETFEELVSRNTNESQEIIIQNLKTIQKQLNTLKEETKTQHSSFTDPEIDNLFQCLTKSMETLSKQAILLEKQACKDSLTEEEKKRVEGISCFTHLSQRLGDISKKFSGHRKPRTELVQKEGEILRLLKNLSSEESKYTGHLMSLERFYRGELKSFLKPREEVVLYSEFTKIYELHKNILKDLKFAVESFPRYPVGRLLKFYSGKFTPYQKYVQNYQESRNLLQKLMKENKEFRSKVKELEKNNFLPLNEVLSLPLRKVETYIMYCEQFAMFTSPKSPDVLDIERATEELQSVLDKQTNDEDLADQLMTLQQIGREVVELDENLVTPDRILVHEGAVKLKREGEKPSDYLFLFNDILILTTQPRKTVRRFVCQGIIGMHNITVEDTEESNEFNLIQQKNPTSKKVIFTICGENERQKFDWLGHFKNVEREVKRSRKVFGVHLKTLQKRDGRPIPHFVEMSINFIREYGLETEGLFRLSGRASQIDKLRDQLDQGKKVFFSENMDVHSVANLFKQWLREMPEPILTWKLYDNFVAANNIDDPDKQIETLKSILYDKLPSGNRKCFYYMLKLLREVIENGEKTKMKPSNLSVVFAPNVLVNCDLTSNPFEKDGVNAFLAVNSIFEVMLEKFDAIFDKEGNIDENEEEEEEEQVVIRKGAAAKLLLRRTSDTLLGQNIKRSNSVTPFSSKKFLPATQTPSAPALATQSMSLPITENDSGNVLLQDGQGKWVERFLVTKPERNAIFIYKNEGDCEKRNKDRIRIPFNTITSFSATPSLGKPFAFQIERNSKKEKIVLSTLTREELVRWISILTLSITEKK